MTQDTAADANFEGFGTGDAKSPLKCLFMLLFSFLFVAGISSLATASQPIFAIEKNFCAGNPALMTQPEACTTATQANVGDPVYYEITISNPWGQPPQTIDLTDQFPAGFDPTDGGLFCKDDLGAAVPIVPSALTNGVAQVLLNPNRTIHCFIPGKFTANGKKTNEAIGISDNNVTMKSKVETDILTPNPLNADLSIKKISTPASVNVTNNPAIVTYTITITNNGPSDVDIADWFQMHDNLSMPSGGTPLAVEYVSASCTATARTDCLEASGPNMAGTNPYVTSESGPTHFFDWGFDKNKGHIANQGVITLTITVKISQLSGLSCVRTQQVNSVINTAFFTLTNPNGTAVADNIPSNNTDSVFTAVTTGQMVDPDCATGQLSIKKEMVRPTPIPGPVAWGATVGYNITITNKSTPQQIITIKDEALEDWLTEGVNTPPFRATHIKTTCRYFATGKKPVACNKFGVNDNTPLKFNYYGHTQLAWNTKKDITLNPGDFVVIYTEFIYDSADCETVPNGQKPIVNTAKIKYTATLLGQPKTSKGYEHFASAPTLMENMEPCNFRVTKTVTGNPKTVASGALFFGAPITYNVTYANNGLDRTIGTIMDAVRINKGNYATSLPFKTSWKCTQAGGVTGATMSGAITSGSAIFTPTPAQGSPAVVLGSNVFFPSKSVLTCVITITVQQPRQNDPYCTTDDVWFENMALMDVTNPFNNNIFWLPSSTYNKAAMSNPPVQDFNWATVALKLPKCWDAHINKTATVDGLPANSAPWTYAGNPNPVKYTITTTNDADSPLGTPNSATPGWTVTDTFAAPYSNSQAIFGSCVAAGWCWNTGTYAPGNAQIGIRNILPSDSGKWNLTLPGSAVKMGQNIKNCAKIKPVGVQASVAYYDNNSAKPGRLESCAEVPVIETTKISVRKQVVDLTGEGVKAMGAFGFSVACSPYAIPTSATSTFSLSTDSSGLSNYQEVKPVAKYGTCTVTETSMPVIDPLMATACNGAANVIVTSSSPAVLTNLLPDNNLVTITNTYKCKPQQGMGQLEVIKSFAAVQLAALWPATSWNIDTNCTPTGSAPSVAINIPSTVGSVLTGSASITAPIAATCTVTEPTPALAFPGFVNSYCAHPANGGGVPVWDTPTYTVNGVTTTTPPTVVIGSTVQTVTVNNGWHCGPIGPTDSLEIIKNLDGPAIPTNFPSTVFNIGVACNAGAAANLPITTPASSNAIISSSGTFTTPENANCVISETPPPMPIEAINHCKTTASAAYGAINTNAIWEQPTFTPSTNIAMGSGVQTVTVTNKWKCVSGQFLGIRVSKTVQGPVGAPVLPVMPFVITRNCMESTSPNSPVSFSVTINTATTSAFVNMGALILGGSYCQISEVQPSLPAQAQNYCTAETAGSIATWNEPIFSLPLPIVGDKFNPVQSLTVTNSWFCLSSQKVAPPKKKKKPKFKINIGIGIGGGGNGADKPRDPQPRQPRP